MVRSGRALRCRARVAAARTCSRTSQDALEDIVYGDDEMVVDVCARKIDLQRLPSLAAVSSTLLGALAEPSGDFVYIRVAAAQRRLEFA